MSKTEDINELLTRMKYKLLQDQRGGDHEATHGGADDILTETIQTLSEGTQFEQPCKEMVVAFSALEKWYA